MQCEICNKNNATVHLTEIVNDKVVEMHICSDCAKLKTAELKEHLTIADFLGGFVDSTKTSDDKEHLALRCSFCGLTYGEFKKKGVLGCRNCYKVFKTQLIPLLRKIHGSVRHTGKSPLKLKKEMSLGITKEELQKQLDRAVHLEEYEEAAHIRDEMKKIERGENKEAFDK